MDVVPFFHPGAVQQGRRPRNWAARHGPMGTLARAAQYAPGAAAMVGAALQQGVLRFGARQMTGAVSSLVGDAGRRLTDAVIRRAQGLARTWRDRVLRAGADAAKATKEAADKFWNEMKDACDEIADGRIPAWVGVPREYVYYHSDTGLLNDNPQYEVMADIVQGTGGNQRRGRLVSFETMELRFQATIHSSPASSFAPVFHLCVVRDTQANRQDAQFTDMFGLGASTRVPLMSLDDSRRFRILYETTVPCRLQPAAGGAGAAAQDYVLQDTLVLPADFLVCYADVDTAPVTNNVFFYHWITDGDTYDIVFNYRVVFYDGSPWETGRLASGFRGESHPHKVEAPKMHLWQPHMGLSEHY